MLGETVISMDISGFTLLARAEGKNQSGEVSLNLYRYGFYILHKLVINLTKN